MKRQLFRGEKRAKMSNAIEVGNLMKEELNDSLLSKEGAIKAKFIFETKEKLLKEMESEKSLDLFKNIEMPLTKVLASMEIEGINQVQVNSDIG